MATKTKTDTKTIRAGLKTTERVIVLAEKCVFRITTHLPEMEKLFGKKETKTTLRAFKQVIAQYKKVQTQVQKTL